MFIAVTPPPVPCSPVPSWTVKMTEESAVDIKQENKTIKTLKRYFIDHKIFSGFFKRLEESPQPREVLEYTVINVLRKY